MNPVAFKQISSEDIEVMAFEELQYQAKRMRLLRGGRDNKKGSRSIIVGALILAVSHAEGFAGIVGLALLLNWNIFYYRSGNQLFRIP